MNTKAYWTLYPAIIEEDASDCDHFVNISYPNQLILIPKRAVGELAYMHMYDQQTYSNKI